VQQPTENDTDARPMERLLMTSHEDLTCVRQSKRRIASAVLRNQSGVGLGTTEGLSQLVM
jgi:hypothetical protein